MVLIPIHRRYSTSVFKSCNYCRYSSTPSSVCPCPKLARDSEFHPALISRQLWNCNDNK